MDHWQKVTSKPVQDVNLASATCARTSGSSGKETRDRTTDWSFVVATLGTGRTLDSICPGAFPSENLLAKTRSFLRLLQHAAFDIGCIRYASQKRMRSVGGQIRSTYVSTRRKDIRSSFYALRRAISWRILELYWVDI